MQFVTGTDQVNFSLQLRFLYLNYFLKLAWWLGIRNLYNLEGVSFCNFTTIRAEINATVEGSRKERDE
jgi:hypothetical protein